MLTAQVAPKNERGARCRHSSESGFTPVRRFSHPGQRYLGNMGIVEQPCFIPIVFTRVVPVVSAQSWGERITGYAPITLLHIVAVAVAVRFEFCLDYFF